MDTIEKKWARQDAVGTMILMGILCLVVIVIDLLVIRDCFILGDMEHRSYGWLVIFAALTVSFCFLAPNAIIALVKEYREAQPVRN